MPNIYYILCALFAHFIFLCDIYASFIRYSKELTHLRTSQLKLRVLNFSYCIHMHVPPPPIGDTIFAVFGMCHPLPLWWPKKKKKKIKNRSATYARKIISCLLPVVCNFHVEVAPNAKWPCEQRQQQQEHWMTDGLARPLRVRRPLTYMNKPTINLNCFAFSYATLRSFCWLTGNRNPTKGNNGNKNCRFVTAIVVVAVRPIFWFIRFFFRDFFANIVWL